MMFLPRKIKQTALGYIAIAANASLNADSSANINLISWSVEAILLQCLSVGNDAACEPLDVVFRQDVALFSLQWPLSEWALSVF